jgi:hypothetical protein
MGHRLGKRVLPLLLVAAGATALAAGASEEPAGAFVSVRVARSGDVPAEQRAQAVAELARQQAYPQHVVVLVHGWDTPYYQSTRQFGHVAPQVRAEFDRLNERAAVLGIQWDSNVGPRRTWIPAAFGHYFFSLLGLRKVIRDPYTSRIPVARTLGRTGLRQILFDVRDRFPEARIHVFAHSMGAEATAHAINPEFTPLSAGDDTPVYRPERPLKLDVVALAGADLDFDSGARSRPVHPAAAPRLLWITLPKIGAKKDKVLTLRKRARSKAAIGNAVPGFRQDQYDALISQRRLVFDTIDIPENHALVDYFRNGRLTRIADAAAGIRDPQHNPSALLKELDAVLAEPADPAALRPHLFGGETSPKVYALWRLEHLLCGSSAHMSSGYAEKVLTRTLRNPAWLDEERGHSECKVVREGFWPPADVVEAARRRRARKQAGPADRARNTSAPTAAPVPQQ